MTIQDFIDVYGITLHATLADSNPSNPDWTDADHWRCVLSRPRGSSRRDGTNCMTTYFSRGYGHNGAEPTAAELLSCLALDSGGYDNAEDFADWCSEYGYSYNSRRAERIYRASSDSEIACTSSWAARTAATTSCCARNSTACLAEPK